MIFFFFLPPPPSSSTRLRLSISLYLCRSRVHSQERVIKKQGDRLDDCEERDTESERVREGRNKISSTVARARSRNTVITIASPSLTSSICLLTAYSHNQIWPVHMTGPGVAPKDKAQHRALPGTLRLYFLASHV